MAAPLKANDMSDLEYLMATKRPKTAADDKEGAAPAPVVTPPKLLLSMPPDIQSLILSCLPISSLYVTMRVSKALYKVSREDVVWKCRLQRMLERKYSGENDCGLDKGFTDNGEKKAPAPIWQRTDWDKSTAFFRWYNEGMAASCNVGNALNGLTLEYLTLGEEKKTKNGAKAFRWLLEDVELITYYRDALAFAIRGEELYMEFGPQSPSPAGMNVLRDVMGDVTGGKGLPPYCGSLSQPGTTSGDGGPGGPSLTQRTPTINADSRIKHNSHRLLLLLHHASRCPHEEGQCKVTPYCASTKRLWRHMANCRDQHCRMQHCTSSKDLLSHYRRCRDPRCPSCTPVREIIRKSQHERE